MTKTIKNITPRAVGDTFDVAYLSDLSAVGSDVNAKIEHIRKAIGGSDWELSSETLTFNSRTYIEDGSYSIKGAFEQLDSKLDSTIGAFDPGASYYWLDPTDNVLNNITRLDNRIGRVENNNYIDSENTVAQNLDALDSATYGNSIAANCLEEALGDGYRTSDNHGVMEFSDTSYLDDTYSVTEAFQALDSALATVDEANTQNWAQIGYLEVANGSYYVEDNGRYWSFPASATYLSAADDLTEALSSLNLGLENAQTAGAVTLSATAGSGGLLSVYTLYQGGVERGTINIPKDFLVKSAALCVVTVADQPYAGAQVGDKYIDFVINAKDASETADHVYLPVNDLVDVYTPAGSATEVQLAIDGSNVISAGLVNGGVTTAKIADGAVTTDKIKLIDTVDSSKAYTIQVANGRLQLREIANS